MSLTHWAPWEVTSPIHVEQAEIIPQNGAGHKSCQKQPLEMATWATAKKGMLSSKFVRLSVSEGSWKHGEPQVWVPSVFRGQWSLSKQENHNLALSLRSSLNLEISPNQSQKPNYPRWRAPVKTMDSSSVAQSYPTLCNPMDCSTPGLPVHHQLPEFTQAHVHWVGDAIQPSHPLSSPSPPTSIFPSIRVFSNESVLRIRWPKCWTLSCAINIAYRLGWCAQSHKAASFPNPFPYRQQPLKPSGSPIQTGGHHCHDFQNLCEIQMRLFSLATRSHWEFIFFPQLLKSLAF